jgi:hypothetical protein
MTVFRPLFCFRAPGNSSRGIFNEAETVKALFPQPRERGLLVRRSLGEGGG